LNKALDAYRALGWYGPAGDIAKAAEVACAFDPPWGEQLAQESTALIEPQLKQTDDLERDRVNGTLAKMVQAFRTYDRERALKVARWMGGSWIHGGSWDSTDGRAGALAMIGLDAADQDPAMAARLLSECLADDEQQIHLGRGESSVALTVLFNPKQESAGVAPGTMRMANVATYIGNCVNY
jgi:hypothetical protein